MNTQHGRMRNQGHRHQSWHRVLHLYHQQPCADFGRDQMKRCHGSAPSRPRKPFLKQLYACKGYPLSSISPIDTVISSSNGIRLALPGVLAHDIPIRHWRRNHRLLQQAVKQHPA